MEQTLTIFYTANLRGDLNLLPRLYILLRRLKQEAGSPTLLLDAGRACDDSVWHCAATGGRSTLLVLDAMGYTAANVSGYLTPAGRTQLTNNLLGMALLDQGDRWENEQVVITAREASIAAPGKVHIVLACDEHTALNQGTLRLGTVETGQVGVIRLSSASGTGHLSLLRDNVLTLPSATPPDPTIAGTIEFVLAEARYHRRKGGSSDR
ncbi:MAG: hypothetical protein K8J31_30415 [Anaerolineae bacterium]|nr:hypothetical protein [Anaerolineae bacterium]